MWSSHYVWSVCIKFMCTLSAGRLRRRVIAAPWMKACWEILPGVCLAFSETTVFLLQSHHLVCFASWKKHLWLFFKFYFHMMMNHISRIFLKTSKDDGQWRTYNLKSGVSCGWGLTWLPPLFFFENVIFFSYCLFFFKKNQQLLRGVSPRKQMKDILRETTVENITTMFCPPITFLKVHVTASECVWVSVCAHSSRCNMELLLAKRRSISIAMFFGTEKKIALFHSGSSAPLPCFPPLFHILFSWVCVPPHMIDHKLLLLCVVVNRGGLGREPEM